MEMRGDHGVRVRVQPASLSRQLPRGLLGTIREFAKLELVIRDDRNIYIRGDVGVNDEVA